VLRWIKVVIGARLTPLVARVPGVRPWMVTCAGAALGVTGGVLVALGWAWLGALAAASGQILDAIDGQLARLAGCESRFGAFLDSVLDRYADGAMVIGCIIYLVRLPAPLPLWALLTLGGLALMGSNAVSYSAARAESLGLPVGPPTMASKGTRSVVMIACAAGTVVWAPAPLVAIVYLAIHPTAAVVRRIIRARHDRHPD